ncbi:MAG: phosphoribosylanthranilate isomerase [Phycisphaerae bacterium]|nr:phosphoribosylanthranilate isomerase [Phycisphaerae bacterium]
MLYEKEQLNVSSTKVKICGITNLDDGLYAIELGCDALGFNFYDKSKRYITPKAAAEIIGQLSGDICMIGVFVNANLKEIEQITNICKLDAVQLHGDETAEFCLSVKELGLRVIKAVRVKEKADIERILKYPTDEVLLDAYSTKDLGGTGEKFNWDWVKDFVGEKIYLAGGVNPDNIEEVLKLGVYGIDVCSGVEKSPGMKDHEKMKNLFEQINNNTSAKTSQSL